MAIEVDLNSDLGEGALLDAEIVPLITSANVACGFHAGNPSIAIATLRLAVAHGVVVGAHPGHPDREHFGRRELPRSPEQAFDDCMFQLGGLIALARAVHADVKYLKPHGALYHQACRDDDFAGVVIAVAEHFDLGVVGLPGSRLELAARDRCRFIAEGFADRRYQADGNLVPRDQPGAFIDEPAEAVKQVEWLLRERGVHTICVHGDNPKAVAFAQSLRDALKRAGIAVRPFA
jgi:5-oxoprolinase (ATP-hydrolysing) subunit A